MAIASSITAAIIAGAAGGGASIYGAKRGGQAADKAAGYQTQAANYAAELEAKSAEKALAFAREQEAARQAEFKSTQDRNRAIYDAEMGRDEQRYTDLRSRLQPFHQFGVGAVGQMGRPIPGSLGARVGRT